MIIKKSKAKGRLLTNTAMLFVLTFSNYLFNVISIPYQTRILGPEVYGNVSFAMTVMNYFQLFLDFGFLLSATEEVSKNRDDSKKVSEIFTSVMWCKLLLVGVSFAVLTVVCITVPRFADWKLFFIFLFSYSLYCFLPDFLYRGLEKMTAITVRSVLIKAFSSLMIFFLLKDKSQYYIVPILTGIGNLGAVIGVLVHVRSLGYRFVKVTPAQVFSSFRQSGFFFFSRIASAVFTSTNTFILGMFYGEGSALVGQYSTAEKGITVAKMAITPVTDSLYPYMIKNRDFKLVKKLMLICMPVLFVGCTVVMIIANPLCAFVFGEQYYDAGNYLRLLAPVVFFAFPGTMFGFPVLTPMGLAKYANISTIAAAVLQIVQFVVIYFAIGTSDSLKFATAICVATCISELFTCLFRVAVFIKNRHKLKEA